MKNVIVNNIGIDRCLMSLCGCKGKNFSCKLSFFKEFKFYYLYFIVFFLMISYWGV